MTQSYFFAFTKVLDSNEKLFNSIFQQTLFSKKYILKSYIVQISNKSAIYIYLLNIKAIRENKRGNREYKMINVYYICSLGVLENAIIMFSFTFMKYW